MLVHALLTVMLGVLPPLQEGIQLYDTLQFDPALVELLRAETEALTVEDRVATQLYLGLVRAELGSMPLAEAAFRNALVLDPSAQLPIKTSPKIEAVFDTVRSQFAEAAAAQAEKARLAQVPPEALGIGPDGKAQADPSDATDGRRVRPMLLGGGALAGLGGGVVFGLLSRGSTAAARDEPIQRLAADRADGARGQAVTANVLYGTAAALAIGAVVDYLFFSPEEPSAP